MVTSIGVLYMYRSRDKLSKNDTEALSQAFKMVPCVVLDVPKKAFPIGISIACMVVFQCKTHNEMCIQ